MLDDGSPDLDPRITELEKPVLGICYGLQALVHWLGGVVEKADDREYGRARLGSNATTRSSRSSRAAPSAWSG